MPEVYIEKEDKLSRSVMKHSGHEQFLFYFILFSDFIEILFFFSFSFRDDEEAHDIAVT